MSPLSLTFAATCLPADIVVQTWPTGKTYKNLPEFAASISNTCDCPVKGMLVTCTGLQVIEPDFITVISFVDDHTCLINSGQPISHGSPIKFNYAAFRAVRFTVTKATSDCR
ncbi:hypothetical protein AMTR_s00016p00220500 [Amborella trichopoda]|uniref:Uncharacterized protein n=1 Tax=Amborella trichopoda TaxID=13333 RepID=W1PEA9_AMBTC|nr:hypothetical protein AMTR_s00016p00220500 [Amborella trichopoda]